MNCAALGEKLFGAGREFHNFLYVGLSTGIGSGIIENDGLYQNSSGFAGELGHTSIDCNGPACSCGNRGCLEEYVGMPVIEARLREATGVADNFAGYCGRADDPRVDAVLSDVIEKITRALVNAVNLLNPQAILIGHNGTHLPARYLEQMERELNRRKFSQDYLKIKVKKSRFGMDSSLYGSGCLSLRRLFEDGRDGRARRGGFCPEYRFSGVTQRRPLLYLARANVYNRTYRKQQTVGRPSFLGFDGTPAACCFLPKGTSSKGYE